MSYSSNDYVVFPIPSLTDLRYLIPFARVLHRHIPELQQAFHVVRTCRKYNGLINDFNYKRCLEIITQWCPWASLHDNSHLAKFCVQVELNSSLECEKRIAIQHGFDVTGLSKNDSYCNVDAYICATDYTCRAAQIYGVKRAIITPFPIALWDAVIHRPVANQVTVFYPDVGDNSLAISVVEHLIAADRIVVVKQRKKHQAIMSAGQHVYDECWYPAESITFPLTSDFTIGFGSSAYIDLVQAGLNYVNIDIHHKSTPWNVFSHPESSNYIRICDESKVLSSIDVALDTMKNVVPVFDDEQLKQFMLKLF